MRLTPAQIAVRLVSGARLPPTAEKRIVGTGSLADRIRIGHEWLVKITGKDFGYDLVAWHAHLKESRDGGYTWGRNINLPRVMKAALASQHWRDAVRDNQARGVIQATSPSVKRPLGGKS